MFRFTIRELLLLTVVAALGVGWAVERWHSEQQRKSIVSFELDAQLSRAAFESLHQDIEQIEKDLHPHGLTLVWSSQLRPSVQKLDRPSP